MRIEQTRLPAPLESIWRSVNDTHVVAPGVEGNRRLTALTGLVLLVLLFFEGITVLNVRGLLSMHIFLGLVLVPPLFLKAASTGYRFASYYLGRHEYRAAGPPQVFLRIIAPMLLVCTVGLFGTGVALLAVGPQGRDTWRGLHQLFFFFWFGFTAIHVLAYTWRATLLGRSDVESLRRGPLLPAVTRQSLVWGSVALGVVLAVAFLPLDTSWLHWASAFRHGG
jgi:hypothetical protein